MGRGRISKSSGGLFGSGIFGFFGTTIKCDSTDNSIFCSIMKIFNLLIVFSIVSCIIYFAYTYFSPSFKVKKSR